MRYLLGLLAAILVVLSLFILASVVLIFALLAKIISHRPLKNRLQKLAELSIFYWFYCNHLVFRYLLHVDIQIMGANLIQPGKNYLVLANHQSWIDILALEEALLGIAGTSRYFIKKNFLYVPIVGWVFAALRFPTMYRFTKEHLAQHPEDKGKDTAITKRSCETLRGSYFKLNIYPEGTRFTKAKHIRQQSPYQYLLKPKAGGVANALQILHDQLDSIINLTLVYEEEPNIINFFLGKMKKIQVIIEKLPITPDLIGNYEDDKEFRVHFQRYLNNLWAKKDLRMKSLLKTTP